MNASTRPLLVTELSRGIIRFANYAAVALLAVASNEVVGRPLANYIDSDIQPMIDLLGQGIIKAYEAECHIVGTGKSVTVDTRILAGETPTACLTSLRPERSAGISALLVPAGRVIRVGTTTVKLEIVDVTALSHDEPRCELRHSCGRSLLDYIGAEDVARTLTWAASAEDHQPGVVHPLVVHMAGCSNRGLAIVLAIRPRTTGFIFTVVDTTADDGRADANPRSDAAPHTGGVMAPGQRALSLQGSKAAPELMARLAPREAEIVTELLNGYRAPSIARRLFLSAGTVRNHLSATYRKLGVKGQQELIELFRNMRS